MPVNSIWEGSGNIMCLDVLRVLAKQPGIHELLADEFAQVKGQDSTLIAAGDSFSKNCVNRRRRRAGRSRSSFFAGCRKPDAAARIAAGRAGVVPHDARYPWRLADERTGAK
jgi:chromosomal replication initiation ATPase DnaA